MSSSSLHANVGSSQDVKESNAASAHQLPPENYDSSIQNAYMSISSEGGASQTRVKVDRARETTVRPGEITVRPGETGAVRSGDVNTDATDGLPITAPTVDGTKVEKMEEVVASGNDLTASLQQSVVVTAYQMVSEIIVHRQWSYPS